MIYLQDNPLLREPLRPEHVKSRLLGHWGASPALSFVYTHLNRVIRARSLDVLFMAGPTRRARRAGADLPRWHLLRGLPGQEPGRGGAPAALQGILLPRRLREPLHAGDAGLHPRGRELGYVLSHACGAAFDDPDLIVAAVVGDGEAETGPLATSWHVNKFLNPIRDGAAPPVLSLNGYKINNPTLLARISQEELESLLRGCGWTPFLVEGLSPSRCTRRWPPPSTAAWRRSAGAGRGATDRRGGPPALAHDRAPRTQGLDRAEGARRPHDRGLWRAHQVPITGVKSDPARLALLERWLRSYKPEELFDAAGAPIAALREVAPRGARRMGANPRANGGVLKKGLRLRDFRGYAVPVEAPGQSSKENTRPLGAFLRDVLRDNPTTSACSGRTRPARTSSTRCTRPRGSSGSPSPSRRTPTAASSRRTAAWSRCSRSTR